MFYIRYANKFSRTYADNTETALRKNLLMQTARFTESANRQGSAVLQGLNYLADRLLAELKTLTGIRFSPAGYLPTLFPYSRDETRKLDNVLPREFDWRSRNCVTHVRCEYQIK